MAGPAAAGLAGAAGRESPSGVEGANRRRLAAGRALPGHLPFRRPGPLARARPPPEGRGVAMVTAGSAPRPRGHCEEPERHIYSIPKAKERLMDRPPPEPERPPDTEPLESPQLEKEAAEQEWPVSEVQGGNTAGRPLRGAQPWVRRGVGALCLGQGHGGKDVAGKRVLPERPEKAHLYGGSLG
ncbi:spermatogenesis-associated protein 33 isoform X3 [Phacochoerus africanus]|uniref:spermatogenesis-associated protein 33 isoform X3 n=1 Tax=Phacochoerus africanus TaxID=41426 RepID=UPI001FDA039B|nr:spermatogenesis-associated protein 33 isoform X3 [Phacochoerus africanus]